MRKLIYLITLTFIPYFAHAAEVTGTWTASFETQVGTQNYTYEFQVQGTELTGTAKSANGEVAIQSGKVDGNAITFVEKLNFQGMELIITYTGELVSDNEIQFKRDVAGIAMEELVAKRSQ
ncbi:MAG TPA: hypothetical protein VJA26_11865 [Gammaproteobacteria bacterium]|nr:hypothetical protein [Gammaproteobacteria bacterium]